MGDTVALIDNGRPIVITGVESFHREQREARAGENVGLRLRNVPARGEIARGQVLAATGLDRTASGTVPRRFCLLTQREGGRAKPIRTGYRPQLFVGTTDVTATLGSAIELLPGAHADVELVLDRAVALETGCMGSRFVKVDGRSVPGVITAVT